MKNKIFFLSLLIFFSNCQIKNQKNNNFLSYENKGFSGKFIDLNIKQNKKHYEVLLNEKISVKSLKITNLINKKNIVISKVKYKKTDSANLIYLNNLAYNALGLDDNLPYIEIQTIRSNPTFVAKKGKEFNEEKKVKNTSRVSNVKIIDLNNKKISKKQKIKFIYLKYGSFYNQFYAKKLNNILKKLLNSNQISVQGRKKSFDVIVGPLNMSKYKNFFKVLKINKYENYEILVK